MSRHHNVHAHGVSHVVNDVKHLPADEVERLYGIEMMEDGSVFDPTYNRNFASIGEWAEFRVEQDELELTEHFGGGHDEFY